MGTTPPTPRGLTPVALGAAVLVLCALVAATFDGPRWSERDRVTDRSSASEDDERDQPEDEAAAPEDEAAAPEDDEPWLPWVPPADLLLLLPVAAVFIVALVVAARLRVVRRRRTLTRRAAVRASPHHDEPAPDETVEDGLLGAIDAGATAIGEGSPRNAIVAAWVRLEQAVVGDHFPHRPEETPSELVERAVASYRLDVEAISRLAALYREARFSAHPVTEEHRDEAADCLRRLLATITTTRLGGTRAP
ncbi:DUF4129 domain-containing protein [Nocardioides stalactiti]|uniref:DUF4129 domain-containing protein n=1 Tax=Nocardioides stalactiti TaxID=2755356 RepID=UPI001600BADC|nr:DUF4129 domain-containing protein [Nocardioides stalactiti]